MERVIAVAAAVVFLLVAGIAAMVGVGIVAEGLNELHRWEDIRKYREGGKNKI